MEEEVWRSYPEFPCSYEVSSFGRVRGKDKVVVKSNGVVCSRQGKILTPQWHKTKVWRVRLCVNGVKYSRSVHRMVAQTFLPNTENKPEVNHKDGSRANNLLTNLEWATKIENMEHAVEAGLIANPFGGRARHFRRAVEVYSVDGSLVAVLRGNREILDFGLCFKSVSACLLGKQRTHRGYTFKIQEI